MPENREASAVLEVPISTKRSKTPMPKKVDLKALREQAKEKRAEIAEARKTLAAANKELRAAQKQVTGIQKLITKGTADLDKIKAKIALG